MIVSNNSLRLLVISTLGLISASASKGRVSSRIRPFDKAIVKVVVMMLLHSDTQV